jgi:hypothetical protein
MADCKDCLNMKNLSERLDEVKRIVDDKGDMFETRITKLERKSDVNDERFDRVFEKLDDIISILKERSGRLPTLVWTVGGMVLGGVFVGVVMWTLGKAIS